MDGDGRKMKGEDSERGREYWLTCNTESGGGRDPANIKYIITFILISLLAPVCLLARPVVATATSAEWVRTNATFLLPPRRAIRFSLSSFYYELLSFLEDCEDFGKSTMPAKIVRSRQSGSRAANRDNLNRRLPNPQSSY